jgi:hypothetical protein
MFITCRRLIQTKFKFRDKINLRLSLRFLLFERNIKRTITFNKTHYPCRFKRILCKMIRLSNVFMLFINMFITNKINKNLFINLIRLIRRDMLRLKSFLYKNESIKFPGLQRILWKEWKNDLFEMFLIFNTIIWNFIIFKSLNSPTTKESF